MEKPVVDKLTQSDVIKNKIDQILVLEEHWETAKKEESLARSRTIDVQNQLEKARKELAQLMEPILSEGRRR